MYKRFLEFLTSRITSLFSFSPMYLFAQLRLEIAKGETRSQPKMKDDPPQFLNKYINLSAPPRNNQLFLPT